MASQDLIGRVPTSRLEVGRQDAFLVRDPDSFYAVERGHVDLFAVVEGDPDDVLTHSLMVARFDAGSVFFGARALTLPGDGEGRHFVFRAVPSRETVLLRGSREHLYKTDSFDLDFVVAIDDWVMKVSEFVTRYEPPVPRGTLLLEADPDVRYAANRDVSTHHLEVLWVSVDRSAQFVGRAEFPLAAGTLLPLSERLWLTLPVDTRVSAVHTPGAAVSGKLWAALDRYNEQILRYACQVWTEDLARELSQHDRDWEHKTQLRHTMVRDLASLMGSKGRIGEAVRGFRSALHGAAAIVAQSVGAEFVDAPIRLQGGDLLDAASEAAAPSGIRTRRVRLSPGWERRDGPSFLGVLTDGGARPVAVVNRGRGSFVMVDPDSGARTPVSRQVADSLGSEGTVFYPPFASGVDSGLAALFQALRGRGRDLRNVALMGALGAIVALLIPILTGQLLGEIIPRVDIPMWTAALAALVVGALATVAFSVVGALSLLRIEARIDETLQAMVWNRLLSLPLPFFRRFLAGDLADRANGVSLIRQMLTGAASSSLVNGVFSVFSFALLFYYSWELALWAGLGTLLVIGGSWYLAVRQMRHQRAVFSAQGKIDGLVFQMIVGLAKIRQANAELNALKWWARKYVEQKRENLSARKWTAGQLTFNAFFMPLYQIALLGLIWYSLIEGDVDAENPFALADFLSFHAAFGQLMAGVTGLTATWATVVAVLPLFERVVPIIKARPETVGGGTVLADVLGRIEFEGVSFRYPSAERDTLQDVSFHVQPGEYVAFVGPSGAGKSTLYRLILGFERPSAGNVFLDGHDLLSLDLGAMRCHMGVVLQNGQLIPNSIGKIISGEMPLTADEVWEAARAVGIEEDIEAMPMGMNTVISEGGAGLSGGQKQRLLVARALARKPRVLLFDEATSMLDNRTQDTVRATLRGMTITRVLIAHRLSTVVDVDRIYVMRDGGIVESGRYRDLMKRGGVLAEMAHQQLV